MRKKERVGDPAPVGPEYFLLTFALTLHIESTFLPSFWQAPGFFPLDPGAFFNPLPSLSLISLPFRLPLSPLFLLPFLLLPFLLSLHLFCSFHLIL